MPGIRYRPNSQKITIGRTLLLVNTLLDLQNPGGGVSPKLSFSSITVSTDLQYCSNYGNRREDSGLALPPLWHLAENFGSHYFFSVVFFSLITEYAVQCSAVLSLGNGQLLPWFHLRSASLIKTELERFSAVRSLVVHKLATIALREVGHKLKLTSLVSS